MRFEYIYNVGLALHYNLTSFFNYGATAQTAEVLILMDVPDLKTFKSRHFRHTQEDEALSINMKQLAQLASSANYDLETIDVVLDADHNTPTTHFWEFNL